MFLRALLKSKTKPLYLFIQLVYRHRRFLPWSGYRWHGNAGGTALLLCHTIQQHLLYPVLSVKQNEVGPGARGNAAKVVCTN